MVVKEGASCSLPGSSKVTPAQWPMPTRETLRELESFGYDYQYVGQGKYRVWVKRAYTIMYLTAKDIDTLIEKHHKKTARALRKKEKQEKDAAKGKTTSKRRRRGSRLRGDKSKGKS